MNNDDFLRDEIKKLKNEFDYNYDNMYEIFGNISDFFSSPYLEKPVASSEVVIELWNTLLEVFLICTKYENKFEAISIMVDILIYAEKLDILLSREPLKEWYSVHRENVHEDISECIEEIIQ
ncbi:MAG: hypothetical protein FWG67_05690 [Defluviitaleaceae bacterium]|nr:hypothetical protein [Defluviitaleaceae bacterium]